MMKQNELNLCANVAVNTDHFEYGLLRTLYYVYGHSYVFILQLLCVIFHLSVPNNTNSVLVSFSFK